jgi:hypothetical protein
MTPKVTRRGALYAAAGAAAGAAAFGGYEIGKAADDVHPAFVVVPFH